MAAGYAGLIRPVALIPVAIVGVLYAIIGHGGVPAWPGSLRLLFIGALLAATSLGADAANQIGDIDADTVNPRTEMRPFAKGDLSLLDGLSYTLIGWGLVLILALLVLPVVSVLLILVVMGWAWCYSFPPRLKDKLGWNSIAIATPRGAIGIAAAFTAGGGSFFSPLLWEVLAVTVVFVLAGNEVRNLQDLEYDRASGSSTFSVVLGERAGRLLTLVGFLSPLPIVLGLGLEHATPWLWLTALYPVVGLYGYWKLDGKRWWTVYYLLFALIGVLFALPFL
jgi:4-hydroxybenzoate polyprenyltransferase